MPPEFSFPPPNNDKTFKNVVADLACNIEVGQPIHEKCAAVLLNASELCPTNNFRSTIASIKKRINDNDLVVSRADNGNTVMILQKTEYDNKVYKVLNSCGATKNAKYSFSAHVTHVRSAINNSNQLQKKVPVKKA